MDFHEEDNDVIRSSRSLMFFKIGVLKNFAIFKRKHLCRSFFLRKLRAWRHATLLKRDSTQVFSCEYCEFFKNTFFSQNTSGGCFLIILLLFLHPSNHLIWLDFFFRKKYYFDFFADGFFYLHNFYSYFLAITRL